MSVHLQREISNLKKSILSLGALVEERVWKAVKAMTERNFDLAREIVDSDYEIDQFEVKIEEDCLKTLALYQPVAIDLRFIVAVLKINNDLERIGDLAANIAKRAFRMCNLDRIELPSEFPLMAEKSQKMLKKSLDALVNLDPVQAQEVRDDDDDVDILNRRIYEQVSENIKKDISTLECNIYMRSVSKNLERVADLATNIAEDVIYTCTGEIVRHQSSFDAETP